MSPREAAARLAALPKPPNRDAPAEFAKLADEVSQIGLAGLADMAEAVFLGASGFAQLSDGELYLEGYAPALREAVDHCIEIEPGRPVPLLRVLEDVASTMRGIAAREAEGKFSRFKREAA